MGTLLYYIILALGAIQGIIMGLMLYKNNGINASANRFLAILLFFFAYRLSAELLANFGYISVNTWTYHLFLEYDWVYGCLIFFYFSASLNHNFEFQKIHRWLFLPLIIQFLFSNYIKIQNFFWDGTRESLSWAGFHGYMLWEHTPFRLTIAMGLIMIYAVKSKKLLFDFESNTKWILTPKGKTTLSLTLNAYVFFAISAIIVSLIDYLFYDYAFNPKYVFPFYIIMAIITYWLGLQGVLNRQEPMLIKQKTSVKDKTLEKLMRQLNATMQVEKPYLNPELTVATLAKTINTKPYLLTKALNNIQLQNFNDYINTYRVEEVKTRINNPEYANQTLLAIAYDSGFNSKASFNRIVKKMTGKPPSALKVD